MATPAWLPPGWTEEMLDTATDEQWDALTPEQYQRIMDRQVEVFQAQDAINDQIFGTNYAGQPLETRGQRAQGIEPNILEALESTSLGEFGFVIFEMHADASDADKWQALKRDWSTFAEDGRTRAAGDDSAADDQGHPWPTFQWVEERAQRDLDVTALITRFNNLQVEEDIPTGLDQGIFLVITPESLASFTETPSRDDYTDSYSGPWVYAVDAGYEVGEGEERGDGYQGYFKVSARSLLTDLWPQLAFGALVPDDLGGDFGEDAIWDGVM